MVSNALRKGVRASPLKTLLIFQEQGAAKGESPVGRSLTVAARMMTPRTYVRWSEAALKFATSPVGAACVRRVRRQLLAAQTCRRFARSSPRRATGNVRLVSVPAPLSIEATNAPTWVTPVASVAVRMPITTVAAAAAATPQRSCRSRRSAAPSNLTGADSRTGKSWRRFPRASATSAAD